VNHKQFIALPGKRFRFANYDPDSTDGLKSEDHAAEFAAETKENLARMQDIFSRPRRSRRPTAIPGHGLCG
jgi:hypothetical protein